MSSATETYRLIELAPDMIGAEIHGLDVTQLTPESPEIDVIRDAIYRHKLLVIRGQKLDENSYIAFTRKVGTPQIYFQSNYHHPDHPEIFVSSNIKESGRKVGVARTGNYWHTDCSFQEKRRSKP